MSVLELSDELMAKLAGWEAVKEARSLVAAGRVLSADWQPPLLKGTVQEGSATYRAGLVIKSSSDADNLCTCRHSRQRGLICAHSVAVGLHLVKSREPAPAVAPAKTAPASPPAKPVKRLRRAQPGETAEAFELQIIFPPNFAQAAARDKVTLYLEARTSKGRVPLNTVPLATPYDVSSEDEPVLERLETLAENGPPAMLMLHGRQLSELLPLLAGHSRVTLGKTQPLVIEPAPWPVPLQARLLPGGAIRIELRGPAPAGLIAGSTAWVFTDKSAETSATVRPLTLPETLAGIFSGPVDIPRRQIPRFLSLDWPRLAASGTVKADFALEDFSLEPAVPRFELHLSGGLAMLQGKLACFYGDKAVTCAMAGREEADWLPDDANPLSYRTRNLAAEQEAVVRLRRHGFTGPDAQGVLHLNGQNAVLNFFAREFSRLEKEWKVTLEERLEKSADKNIERIEPRFAVTNSGEQWFDFQVAYTSRGGERFSPADIQSLLRSGQGHTRLKNGKFAVLDTGAVEELQEVLVDCAPQQQAGGYRLHQAQAGFLEATLRGQGWTPQAPAAWSQRVVAQQGEVKLPAPPLGALDTVLRPYQKEGVGWLHFLRVNGFGGILADEMGLGKTLQVLALLQAQRAAATEMPRAPSLVVCPTSLVFNWVAEAAKFTPELRVLAMHGPGRASWFARLTEFDLVITSYALVRRDAEQYREVEFDTVVLDEAQHIKNRDTQNAQAVKSIRSRHRLALTGTPLENSVLDLWSMFDFLMPGYLGAAKDFRERYELPIVRDRHAGTQQRLLRRVRPFVLRRLKREVAADLPEKIEQVSYCELNEEQRAVYQQILEASRREIHGAVDAQGLARSRMLVLTALLRLRQVCCDLRLLGSPLGADQPEPSSDRVADEPAVPSGKLEMFGELLEEVLDGGHRVLVFSQFTRMLGLLRETLQARQITSCYLDGATRDRARVVEEFQREARIPVFLISLKAGGTGLNLTGADTVIHFDPWWNPAVEAQATDRAHRIGQRKVVTSYKLITRGTVEEKILNLQNRKRALIQGVLGGEEKLVEALDWEEIQELLAG